MHSLEYVAAVFGIACVYLGARQNIWSWPTTIVNVALYAFVFHSSRLYAATGLQVMFIIISIYGWYQWLYGGRNRTELKVSRTPRRLAVILALIGGSFALLLGTLLYRTTNAALPFLDSALSSASLVAQWMLTKKLLENWLVWIAVDVVYVGMFLASSLTITAGLYFVFLVLCVMGYRQWKESLSEPELATAEAA
jgi:nicotinamide mononucleotide transporter